MTSINQLILALSLLFFFTSCKQKQEHVSVRIKNSLSFERTNETVEIRLSQLNISPEGLKGLKVKDQNEEAIVNQLVDKDGNGIFDVLIFQPKLAANSELRYTIHLEEDTYTAESKVYSRFVPERIDDFAWENDKVAFRTYGPTAQKMIEEDIPGGTLSSGIDCWLKKVDYPIIDKWYEKQATGTGSYHEDTGEGLDNYHVGSSRGCGGLGVYEGEELYTSGNFTGWTIHSNGPVRTGFSFEYDDWFAGKEKVKEAKNISLDLGSNLMKIEAKITGSDVISIGLTLHENDGEISIDSVNGWFSYWQPHGESELGTAIVCLPGYYKGYTHLVSGEPDKSHLLVHLKVIDGKVEYYSGFGWKESKQFHTKDEWEKYLERFSKSVKSPLEIEILNASDTSL